MAHQRNGYENVGFSKKDMYNIVNRKTRLKLKDGDAMAMLQYFHNMTEENQNFYHTYRVDEIGRLKDVMWVDARSRVAYQDFGDVRSTRLYQFAPRYCKAMESRATDEQAADANNKRYVRPLITERDISDGVVEHVIEDRVWIWSNFKKKEVPVEDRKRIPCSHIIKVLDLHSVKEVPKALVLDRWRKDITRKHTMVKVANHDPFKTEEVQRYDKAMVALEPILLRASMSVELSGVLMEKIRVIAMQFD
ncbi:uncharacterized protein LOC110721227 [Chenopodium quinoa]|uniref:uncharacterized protein LOC110721227 n=1 Tax=Chenopodium quinoa TaxID=63459 RepID=UPI000B78898B|nr:uncharacterized protein LOC110721227 [Chenopodium quinoa]